MPHELPRQSTEPFVIANMWYVAGWDSEFDPEVPLGRTVIGKPIVLYRTRAGSLVAFEDRCAHRWARLSFGRVEGDDLRCMYHGLKFAPNGRCIEVPGQDRIAESLRVRTYPVLEKHRLVWVWMGESALANPDLIPDLSMLDQPWRRLYFGALNYEANYFLINDNLLDFSHLSFLHEKTLGRPANHPSGGREKPRILGGSMARTLERGVRVEGWVCGPAARVVILPKNVPDGDLWSRVDFLVPGILISHAQLYPEGTAERCQFGPPGIDVEPMTDAMSIQAVTPVTAHKTRYFYSLGPRAADMNPAESDAIWKITLEAFAEDLRMIEGQQEIIDSDLGGCMGGIAADRGLVMFRNLMKKLKTQEAGGVA